MKFKEKYILATLMIMTAGCDPKTDNQTVPDKIPPIIVPLELNTVQSPVTKSPEDDSRYATVEARAKREQILIERTTPLSDQEKLTLSQGIVDGDMNILLGFYESRGDIGGGAWIDRIDQQNNPTERRWTTHAMNPHLPREPFWKYLLDSPYIFGSIDVLIVNHAGDLLGADTIAMFIIDNRHLQLKSPLLNDKHSKEDMSTIIYDLLGSYTTWIDVQYK